MKLPARTSAALSQGQPIMLPPGHEAAGADDVAAGLGARHHGVEDAGIVVVVGRQHDRERRRARGKARQHGAMGAAPAVAHEIDRQRAERRAIVAIAGSVSSSSRS